MRSHKNNRGVTLVEIVVSIVVLGIAIPPLIGLFSEIARATPDDTYQRAALSYAESLMEEIRSKNYEDPDEATGSFGTEEVARTAYDDVDDYDGLSNSLPRHVDGSILADYGGFTRSATVNNVTATNLDSIAPQPDGSTNFKRIRVTVAWAHARPGEITLTTIRTSLGEADQSGPIQEAGSAGSAFNHKDDEFEMVLISESGTDLRIRSFSLSASRSVPELEVFELATKPGDFKKLWDGDRRVPTGTLFVDKGNPNQRVLPAGAPTGARFEFDDEIKRGPITFTLVLNFTDGSSSTLVIPFTWTR